MSDRNQSKYEFSVAFTIRIEIMGERCGTVPRGNLDGMGICFIFGTFLRSLEFVPSLRVPNDLPSPKARGLHLLFA